MKCDHIRTRMQGDTPFFPNMLNNGKVEVCLKEDVDKALAEKDAEIRRLKRALYKACANWADVEVFERTVGIDDPNVEANRWALMRNKCLKKAEGYK